MHIQLTTEQLIKKVKAVIAGHRHKWYKYTVKKAEFYNQLVTGVNQDALILQYKERETDAQKKQRLHLTHTRTKSASNKVSAMYNRVFEVEKLNEQIDYIEPNPDRLTLLKARTNAFQGKKSVEKYLNDATLYFNLVDPNAFLLVAYTAPTTAEGQIVENPFSYPIEIHSSQAVDYEYIKAELAYLITAQKAKVEDEVIKEFFAYSAGVQLYIVEVKVKAQKAGFYPPDFIDSFKEQGINWLVYETDVTTTEVPAMQFGYLRDYATKRQTFAGILDSAEYEFRDLINRKSEEDITLALHTFMQKFQIAEPCEFQDGQDTCDHGRMTISQGTCPECQGSGLQSHTTSQQVMLVKRGVTKEENIPLKDMAHYLTMPFDIVEHQHKLVRELPKDISIVIFGVDISERPTQNVTATAISNYFESLYAVLAQFADQYSELYMFTVKTIAEGALLGEGLTVNHKFPRDFELLTLGELLVQLKSAKDAGAPNEVIRKIEETILAKQNQSSPEKIQFFRAKEAFKPFKNISEQLLINTLNGLSSTDVNKIKYLYNGVIFESIKQTDPDFASMPIKKQTEIVMREVAKIQTELAASEAVTFRDAVQGGSVE